VAAALRRDVVVVSRPKLTSDFKKENLGSKAIVNEYPYNIGVRSIASLFSPKQKVQAGSNYSWALPELTRRLGQYPLGSIAEVGSRDGLDGLALSRHFKCPVQMFEPDPQNILLCEQTIAKSLDHTPVILHKVALSETTGLTDFYTVDQETYNNPGVAGLYQLDFSNRPARDPDRGRGSVNKLTRVQAFRFDELGLPSPDLLFMDVEGAELNVLRGFGSMLSEVKAIVLESSFWNTYRGGGSTFPEVSAYLEEHGFNFVSSNNRGRTAGKFPMARKIRSYLGQYEAAFDSLWMRM